MTGNQYIQNAKKEDKHQPVAAQKNNSIPIEDNRLKPTVQLQAIGAINQTEDNVVQRKIIYDYGAHEFSHNGTRPQWRKSLKTWTAGVYNLHSDLVPAHPPRPAHITNKTNLGNHNLARTHKIPFHQMQLILENFCNGTEALVNLQSFCNLVIKTPAAHGVMLVKLAALNVAKNAFTANATANNRFAVIRTANQLLTELHNSIDNILIGDSGTNSGIAERGDWNFAAAAGGAGTLTPISGEAYDALSSGPHAPLVRYNPGLYSPGGQVASSHIMSVRPNAIIAHDPANPVFATKNWRGPGDYVNGVLGTSGNIRPAGIYANQPL